MQMTPIDDKRTTEVKIKFLNCSRSIEQKHFLFDN